MMSRGWQIVDRYRNTTRDNMPVDETITSFADRLIDLAERVIVDQGGGRKTSGTQVLYRIPAQEAGNVLPLAGIGDEVIRLRARMSAQIEQYMHTSNRQSELAFAAYAAICLDMAEEIKRDYPAPWTRALEALASNRKVMQVLFFESPIEAGDRLRQKATSSGLKAPKQRTRIW